MKKKSSYQKLKEQNALLRKHIHAMVTDPDSQVAKMIIKQYQMKFRTEKAMWSGSIGEYNESFDGIIKYIS